jgi:hypothetical protein
MQQFSEVVVQPSQIAELFDSSVVSVSYIYSFGQILTRILNTFIQYLVRTLLESAPAHVSPEVASFCPHSPLRHVIRSLVATLISRPMLSARTVDPTCHVTRSLSLCNLGLRSPIEGLGETTCCFPLSLGALVLSRPLEQKKKAMMDICDTSASWSLGLMYKSDTVVLLFVIKKRPPDILFLNASTQLALQSQQERTRVVRSNGVARKLPARRYSCNGP